MSTETINAGSDATINVASGNNTVTVNGGSQDTIIVGNGTDTVVASSSTSRKSSPARLRASAARVRSISATSAFPQPRRWAMRRVPTIPAGR
jgi:hypothetical protein